MPSSEIKVVAGPRPSSPILARVLPCLTLAVIFAAGAVLRFRFLASKPFWFDECFSIGLAWLSWRDFALVLWKREANMSLYYALLRGWLHFGGSTFFIRSLSVLAAVATLPAIYWLGRLLFDRRTALLATALLACNAYNIRYAQEARSYALLVLLCTLSSASFVSVIGKPTRRAQIFYVMASVLAVYAHFYALLLIAAQWAAFRLVGTLPVQNEVQQELDPEVARKLRRSWRWIGILVLPVIAFVAKTGAGPIRWIQRPGLRDVLEYYEHMAGNYGWQLLLLFVIACVFAVAPSGRALFRRSRTASWETWRCQFLLIWMVFPVALTVALSYARPLFYGRYVSFCLPAFILLAASGIARLSSMWTRTSVLAVLLFLSLRGTADYYRQDFDIERDGIGKASYFVLDHSKPGDALIFHIAATRAAYQVFQSLGGGGGAAGATLGAGPEIVYPNHSDRLEYRDFTGNPPEELVRAAMSGHPRAWVVLMYNGTAPTFDTGTRTILRAFEEQSPTMQSWQFPGVEVRLYRRR